MPRPADTYTHAQFESIESDHKGETVRCVHCKNWTGSIKTLSRKKEHLLKCASYAAWRAAGNGQDLAPPNRYNKRDSSVLDDSGLYDSSYGEVNYTPNPPPRNKLHATDLSKAFHEFWDDAETQKCMRARCKYCGAVRAKNTTRQYEHLQQCTDFLSSAEGQQAQADGTLHMGPVDTAQRKDIWRGGAPNPNLGLAQAKIRTAPGRPTMPVPVRVPPKPSLVTHLLLKHRPSLEDATQLPFLSHAGCGTLSATALRKWLCQQGHLSRALTTFIGSVIGKIRLVDTKNPQADTSFRAFDLLLSTLNNAKRELEFLRSTQLKYGLIGDIELPRHATKSLIDLFASTASPAASLLEGLVVLWAVEYLYNISWQYAANFYQPDAAAAPTSTSYTLPSYLQPGQYETGGPVHPAGNPDQAHIAALHEALIPNWTSTGFSKFVEACKAIVDELANAQTSGSGATELNNCEGIFRQVCWLWKQTWPTVTGMGESDEPPDPAATGLRSGGGPNGPRGGAVENGAGGQNAIEIPDDEEDDGDGVGEEVDGEREVDAVGTDSPFGGTGLGAVAAANRSG